MSHLDQPATGHVIREVSNEDVTSIDGIDGDRKKKLAVCQKHIEALKLDMKLIDVEQLFGGERLVVFYLSEDRVDFRELVKLLAGEFQTRIEMRQIGVRQEAAKIGGIGSCGRELCCSTWMTDFPSVTTGAARYQQLSINPQKISGQCGRLKCCLNFELDSYTEALQGFPSTKTRLKTKKGNAKFVKLDVFKNKMSYYYQENPSEIIDILVEDVKKIIALNKSGTVPEKIEDFSIMEEESLSFKNATELAIKLKLKVNPCY